MKANVKALDTSASKTSVGKALAQQKRPDGTIVLASFNIATSMSL